MRSYGKRFINRGIQSVADQRTETRDGIIWDVDLSKRIAYVRIQGSITQIRAYFPQNWKQVPYWCKKGIAVKIMHTGGVRGRIELVGEGNLIPTAVSGSSLPSVPVSENVPTVTPALLAPDGDYMVMLVKTGTIRVSGIEYAIDAIIMSDTTLFVMGMGGYIGEIAGVVAIDTAPVAGTYRYDMIVVGIDRVFDYIKGVASSTPVMPDTPADHVKCGHILLYPNLTKISQPDVNKYYTAIVPAWIEMTIADDDLAWTELSTTITVTIKDMYGNAVYQSGEGWYLTLTIDSGNGKVRNPAGEESTSSIGAFTGANSNEVIFTYIRNQQDPGDESPVLSAAIDGYDMVAYGSIELKNSSGKRMPVIESAGQLFLSAAGGWPATTNGSSANVKLETATNKQDVYVLDFDKDTKEYAEFTVAMPSDWDGKIVTAVFYWLADATTGNVVWGCQGRSYGDSESLDQAWGTGVTVTDSASAAANQVLISAISGEITLAGTPAGGELAQFRVYRDAANAADTLAVDARLMGIMINYKRV